MSAKKSEANEQQINEEIVHTPAAKKTVKKVDPNMAVPVRNGFQGKLVYVSKKTGEKYIWEAYGDEQYIELSELRNAKGASKAFFENNWFMFDDEWVPEYLGVSQFYKNAIPIDGYDQIFEQSPSDVERLIAGMNDAQKRSAAYRARALIEEGKIDSNRVIAALERALGFDLLER